MSAHWPQSPVSHQSGMVGSLWWPLVAMYERANDGGLVDCTQPSATEYAPIISL